MEETIKRIISIDKDAENYRIINDEILFKKKEELQKEIQLIIDSYLREIEIEMNNITTKLFLEADNEVEKIKIKENNRIKRMTEDFNDVKQNIEEEAFQRLIKTFKEA